MGARLIAPPPRDLDDADGLAMNLTASEARWFVWAVGFAVLVGIVIGLATAEWALVS